MPNTQPHKSYVAGFDLEPRSARPFRRLEQSGKNGTGGDRR